MRAAWLVAGLGLGVAALPRFADGVTIDRAIPVPSYMIAGRPLDPASYRAAAAALGRADPADGDSHIADAEAQMKAGVTPARLAPELENALFAAPASPRGWLLLSNALAAAQPPRAAAALSQALILAPYDYWVAGGRARAAAALWPALDRDTRQRALAQVHLLWDEPQLRPQLLWLLSSPGGAALVTRTFAQRRDDLVALNRFVSAARRQSATAR